jgi:hypothetical protein
MHDNRACTWISVLPFMLISYDCKRYDRSTVYIELVRLRRMMQYVNETRFECKFECLDTLHVTI